MLDSSGLDVDLLELQDQLWASGKYVPVEEVLAGLPEPGSIPDETKLDLIWNERVWRSRLTMEEELNCLRQEYCRRFPHLESAIALEFECEHALGESFSECEDLPNEPDRLSNCTQSLSAPHIPNHYIIEEYASGGGGIVYRARQLLPDREVALKLLDHRALIATHAGDIHQEADRIGQLRHRNIVEVYVAGVSDGSPYFTMPLVKDGNLNSRIVDYKNQFQEIAKLMIPIVKAIEYAHELGVLHCDIKPSNILMDGNRPLLADFGMAVSKQYGAVACGGTPAYMAPEQFVNGGEVSVWTDIYGLGAVMYHLLTGCSPGRTKCWEAAAPVRSRNKLVPKDLEAICMKCLEKDGERRYANASELLGDLEQFLQVKPVIARPLRGLRSPERLSKWAFRAPWAAAFVALIFLSLPVLTVLNFRLNSALTTSEELADEQARNLFELGALGVERSSKHLALKPYERSEELFEMLANKRPDSSERRLRLAKTRKNLASLYHELGEDEKSYLMSAKALRDFELLETQAVAPNEVLSELADLHANLGNHFKAMRKNVQALEEYRLAMAIRTRLVESYDTFKNRVSIAESELDLGNAFMDSGSNLNEAESHFKKAITLFSSLLNTIEEQPSDLRSLSGQRSQDEVRDRLQQAKTNLGYLFYGQGRLKEAESAFVQAEELLQALANESPDVASYIRNQAAVGVNLGLVWIADGRIGDGLDKLTQSAEKYRKLQSLEGNSLPSHVELADCLCEISRARFLLAQQSSSLAMYSTAEVAAQNALKVCTEVMNRQPTNERFVASTAQIHLRLGDIAYGASEFDPTFFDASGVNYERSLSLFQSLKEPLLSEKLQRLDLFNNYGRMSLDRSDFEKSKELLELGVKLNRELAVEVPSHPRIKDSMLSLCNALGNLYGARASLISSQSGKLDELLVRDAIGYFAKGVAAAKELDPTLRDVQVSALALQSLVAQSSLLEQLGSYRESLETLSSALAISGSDAEKGIRFRLAGLAAKIGDFERAEENLNQCLKIPNPAADDLYNTSCVYSLLYAAVLNESNAGGDGKERSSEAYRDGALAALSQLRAEGYFDKKETCVFFATDADFKAIRSDPLFKEFVDSLVSKPN